MPSSIMPVYNPAPVVPVRGEGPWLIDENGERWLDCIGGVATNALGHAHPALVAALTDQAQRLWHVSNALRIPAQAVLAEKLTASCFADVVFFCNTGTEAVEAAIKTVRRFHAHNGDTDRVDVIGFHGSFHGRTYAALNAAGNRAYLDGFGPPMPGFVHLAIDDYAGFAEAVARPTTAAVIVEPVQGEGGARAVAEADLRRLRERCSAHGVLLIHDEVQSGMGRTGRLFAHQWFDDAAGGVAPDIMALAKALGGGFPVGACLATAAAAGGMTAATHGSTFGGNPLAMAVANAAFDLIADPATLDHARRIAEHLRAGLRKVAVRHPETIVELRGKGLLIGLKLVPSNRDFMAAARAHRLLLSGCGDNCVRILPPLTLGFGEADAIVERIAATCAGRAATARIAA